MQVREDLLIDRNGGRIAKWTLLDEGPGGLQKGMEEAELLAAANRRDGV
jgi:hypothetical protein